MTGLVASGPITSVRHPERSLPLASTDPQEVVAAARALLEQLDGNNLKEAEEAAKSILSSGQILAAQVFLKNQHENPLPIVEKLTEALDSSSLEFDPDFRYLLARTLRLFSELTLLRTQEPRCALRFDRQQKVLQSMETLIKHAEKQEHPGLKFELQCVQESCRRWTSDDQFWKRYGPRILELVIDLATIEGAVDAIRAGVSLVRDLAKERNAGWYDRVFYLDFLGNRATQDLGLFTEIHTIIKQAYQSRQSKTDKKSLIEAVDVLSGLVWRGSSEISRRALEGYEGAPGLIALAQIKPLGSFMGVSVDKLGLWGVRYHALCHLDSLQNHPNSLIIQRARDTLSTRSCLEVEEKVQRLLAELPKRSGGQAYQGLFYTDTPRVWAINSVEQIEDQRAELRRQEDQLRMATQDMLRSKSQESDQVRAALDRASEQSRDLERIQRALHEQQSAFFQEIRRELSPAEKEWPAADHPNCQGVPVPLRGLYLDFQNRQFGNRDNAQFINQGIQYYVPLKTKRSLEDPAVQPIEQQIEAFFQGSESLLLLQGDSGSGKSLYECLLERHFWDNWEEGGWTPILIELRTLRESIEETLVATCGYTLGQIDKLKANTRVAFFLDGYDEMGGAAKNINLHKLVATSTWVRGCKIVVSCRTQYLSGDSDYWTTRFSPPRSRNDFSSVSVKNECFVAPLTEDQIGNYVERVGALQDYQQALNQFPQIQQLLTTPLMLRLVTETLPDLLRRRGGQLERVDIYDAFIKRWFAREFVRLEEMGHHTLPRDTLRSFSRFSEDLAFQMYLLDSQQVRMEARAWARFFSDEKPETALARAACPLRQVSAETYAFFHKSFMEYFAAQYLAGHILRVEISASNDAPQQGSNETISQLTGHPLNQKRQGREGHDALLQAEPAILEFLAPIIARSPSHQEVLFDIVTASRNCPEIATASANAITILNGAQVSFSGRDLKGITVPFADFNGALLHWTDMEDADLHGALLGGAQLVGINLRGANLDGVYFGQLPMIVRDQSPTSIDCSPCGTKLLLGRLLGAEVWDLTSNKTIATFEWSGIVRSAYFDRSGERVAIACDDSNTLVWDWMSNKQPAILKGHTKDVNCAKFSNDGKHIASANEDGTIVIWDIRSGYRVRTFIGHTAAIYYVSFSPNNERIVSASEDGTAKIWDVNLGTVAFNLADETIADWVPRVHTAKFSPDGRQVVSAANSGTYLWDAETGAKIMIFGQDSAAQDAAFSPDGQLVVKTYGSGADVWSIRLGTRLFTIVGHHSGQVRFADFSPDQQYIITGGDDTKVKIWNISGHKPSMTSLYHDYHSISFAVDGRHMLLIDNKQRPWIWNTLTKERFPAFAATGDLNMASLSADGSKIATVEEYLSVKIRDARTGQIELVVSRSDEIVWWIKLSRDGSLVAIKYEHKVQIWNAAVTGQENVTTTNGVGIDELVPKGKLVATLTLEDASDVSFAPGNDLIATTTRKEKGVVIWDIAKGESIRTLDSPRENVLGVEFSPDCRHMATFCGDYGLTQIWDIHSGQVLHNLKGRGLHMITNPHKPYTAARYSADGKKIVTEGEGEAHVWDAITGAHIQALQGNTIDVWDVTWHSSNEIITTGPYGMIVLWRQQSTYQGDRWCMVWCLGTTDLAAQGCILHGAKISDQNRLLLEQKGAEPVSEKPTSLSRATQTIAGAGSALREGLMQGLRKISLFKK